MRAWLLQVTQARMGLPIIGMEQEIVETVNEHDVVVLCGETGCGKTTQVREPPPVPAACFALLGLHHPLDS